MKILVLTTGLQVDALKRKTGCGSKKLKSLRLSRLVFECFMFPSYTGCYQENCRINLCSESIGSHPSIPIHTRASSGEVLPLRQTTSDGLRCIRNRKNTIPLSVSSDTPLDQQRPFISLGILYGISRKLNNTFCQLNPPADPMDLTCTPPNPK